LMMLYRYIRHHSSAIAHQALKREIKVEAS